MKKVLFSLLIAGMLIVPTSIQAEGIGCEKVESMARTIMTARQQGIPMKKIVSLISESGITGNGAKALKIIIIEAYDTPNYSSSGYEKEAINEFANKYYRSCVKNKMSD